MDKTQVFLLAAVLAIVAVRLYRKYMNKDKSEGVTKSPGDSSFKLSSKDDDYEPYSKK